MPGKGWGIAVKGFCAAAALALAAGGAAWGRDIPVDLSGLPALESGTATPAAPAAAAREDQPFFVLCYHRFLHRPDAGESESRAEYQMPVEEFEWQMRYLKDKGFTLISDRQLMDYWFKGKPLPPKPVLLTFDDGFRTIYRDAFPVVKSFGYPSILFLYTKFIENEEKALKRQARLKERRKVNLETQALEEGDILAMEKDGMVVESHTLHHLNMVLEAGKMDAAAYGKLMKREYGEPLTFIAAKFHHRPGMLAYPYGVYSPAILETVREEGYKLAFTVNPGPNDRTLAPLMLKRNLVLYPISHARFAAIFKDRVLHLSGLTPADGTEIHDPRPLIRARIEDRVKPGSVRLLLKSRVRKVDYDPATGRLSYRLPMDMRGGDILRLSARDVKGFRRVYSWYFRVVRPYEKEPRGGEGKE